MRSKILGLLAVGLLAGAPGGAQAAIISGTVDFNVAASAWIGGGGPWSGLSGSIGISFDNSAEFVDAGVTVNSLSPFGTGFPVSMTHILEKPDLLFIGGTVNGAAGAGSGTDDFYLTFSGVSSGNLSLVTVGIALNGVQGIGSTPAGDGSFASFTPTPSGTVPEPSTFSLALLSVVGVSIAGFASRRRAR